MTLRPTCIAALVAASALALSGCGADLDAAARASAKCGSAVHDELGLGDQDTALHTETLVTETDGGQHVEGDWEHPDVGEGSFTCDVVPDEADHLRGLRVTGLDVERIGG